MSETAIALIEKTPAAEIFKVGFLDPVIGRIRQEAQAEASKLDISTKGGREAIASLAFKVAKSKTFIEAQRKALVADEKKRLQVIDKEGSRVWDELESLQHEIRKPLTDWENAEKERVAAHEQAIAAITEGNMYGANESSTEVEARLRYLEGYLDSRDWQEFSHRAAQAVNAEIVRTKEILERVHKREKEAAELARLRAEQAEREQRERDERIAREAREKAEREAKEREERAYREAQAEKDRQTAELNRIARESEAKIRAAELAAQQALKDAESAVERERIRVQEERKREEAEQQAREKDRAHKASVNNAAANSLIEVSGITEQQAKTIIASIAKGIVPNVKVAY